MGFGIRHLDPDTWHHGFNQVCPPGLHLLVHRSGDVANIDLIGGFIREIDFKTNKNLGIRKVICDTNKIFKAMMARNDINHVSVIFRKDTIIKLGGYPECVRNCQDYYLWLL